MSDAVPPPDAVPAPDAVPPGPGPASASASGPHLAAELAQLEHQVGVLAARAAAAHQAWVNADQILRATVQRRDEVAATLRFAASTPSTTTTPAPPSAPAWGPAAAGPAAGAPVREASTRTVQNVLFVLGGLLLGTAAIVFTAVAWATFGVQGRAMILAGVTLVTLALPFLALWRKLRATAETFAAIGLLLVVLDGWAAYSVDLLGAREVPPNRYAGVVCLAAVAVAVGYGWVTRLGGPGFAALLLVQPVPLLLVVDSAPGPAIVSLTFAALAVIDLSVVASHRRGATPDRSRDRVSPSYSLALRITAWVLFGIALCLAGLLAAAALIAPSDLPEASLAAAALVTAALLLGAASALTRITALRALAAAGVVLSLDIAGTRLLAFEFPAQRMLLLPLTVASVSLLLALIRRALPEAVGRGLAIGAAIGAGIFALPVWGIALGAGLQSLARALPAGTADLTVTPGHDWRLAAAIALVAVALAAPLPRVVWGSAVVVPLALLALALPDSFGLAWWAAPALDLVAAAVLATIALTRWPAGQSSTVHRVLGALAASALVVHAIGASLARPGLTAATFTGVVVLGLVLTVTVPVRDPLDRAVRGGALFGALTALPPAVGAWAVQADLELVWVARLTVGSVALVIAALAALNAADSRAIDGLVWYAYAAAIGAAASWPVAVALRNVESPSVYSAIGLVALGAALVAMPYQARGGPGSQPEQPEIGPAAQPGTRTRAVPDHVLVAAAIALVAATPSALVLLAALAPSVFAVAAAPYSWLSAVWSGAEGVGLTPADGEAGAQATDAVGLGLLSLACALASFALTRRGSSALAGAWIAAPTAVLVALVGADAPWPAVPATTVLIGLITFVAASLAAPGPARTTIAGVQSVVYIGAGITGMLALRWSTLAALGLTVIAAAIVGAAGRAVAWRVVGWLGAVGFGLATATAAVLAADLRLLAASYGVLAVAVLSLALGATLGRLGRRTEAVVVETAAHASAVVALLYTIGWPMSAASICALWGVAVGLRALWPGTGRTTRAALAAVAAGFELVGWWLLLADRAVSITEAYTLPLAGVALLAGWARLRARPEVGSWVAYGPALAAAFLPSLAIVLITSGNEWRRLGLGAFALLVVVAGALRRLRAPVLIGGAVLLALALHEVVVWWERVPGWIPLAVGGALLVGLAITYERRRRDLARLREALRRMT